MYDNKPVTIRDGEPDRNSKVAARMCYIPAQTIAPGAEDTKDKIPNDGNDKTPAEQEDAAGVDKRSREGKDIILTRDESKAIVDYLGHRQELEEYVRLTPALANASSTPGTSFSALDLVQRKTLLQNLEFYLDNGVISGLLCRYVNGVSWRRGKHGSRRDESMS
jgi:hypothetical protein